MGFLIEETVYCPYCGEVLEVLEVLIDPQEAGQQYTEDCQVCCKPILFNVGVDAMGHLSVSVQDENETY